MTSSYDYIVIGAGIMGAYTAYILSKSGFTVLMIEQFTAPNSRGSSSGSSRQIYKAMDDPHKASMMEEIYADWIQLEKETTLKIINLKTGMLLVGKTDSGLLQFRDYLKANKPTFEYDFMTGEELTKRYPIFNFDDKFCAILDKSGGMLMANNCLTAQYTEFKRHDGIINENEVLVHVRPISDTEVSVKTEKGTYTAIGVVLTAGAWTAKILDTLGLKLPLTTTRKDVWYYKQHNTGKILEFPCFATYTDQKVLFSLPLLDQPGMAKVVFNGGSIIDPDNFRVGSTEPDKKNTEFVADFIRTHMPTLSTTPMVAERGIATFTPDRNFIIDRHPKFENIVIGAGFSGGRTGRGFQFAPVIGKLLAELVTKQKPSYDLEPFSLKRFSAK